MALHDPPLLIIARILSRFRSAGRESGLNRDPALEFSMYARCWRIFVSFVRDECDSRPRISDSRSGKTSDPITTDWRSGHTVKGRFGYYVTKASIPLIKLDATSQPTCQQGDDRVTKEKGDKRSRRGCLTFYIPDGLNTKGAKLLPCWWELMRSPKRNGLLTCTSNQDLPLLFNKRGRGREGNVRRTKFEH